MVLKQVTTIMILILVIWPKKKKKSGKQIAARKIVKKIHKFGKEKTISKN